MTDLPSVYSVGTVSVGAGGTVVTGSGMSWLAAGVRAGDIFWAEGLSVSVASVDSATQITLAAPWPGAALSGSGFYELRFIPDATRVLTASREAISLFYAVSPHASYAAALAAPKPTPQNRISALIGGRLVEWHRDAAGPCLGGGWSPVGDVMPLHFDMSDVSLALRDAMTLASQIGAKLLIPRGDYVIASSVSAVLQGNLIVEFESGARLVAASGLNETVFYPRGAASDQPSWENIDLTVINPQIDCTAGSSPYGVGGGFCSALSFNYMRNVRVVGGNLYGGELIDNSNADSGISWVTCGNVVVDGVRIRGFNDAGIYPGGNNDAGASGDGGPCRITNCLIQRCASAIAAKREMDLLVVESNTIEDCKGGVSTENVTSAGGVLGARRLEVIDNTFRRVRANVIRPRGIAKGVAKGNTIIDWGFLYDGTSPTGANGVALNIDGTQGFDWSGNTFALDQFPADNQVAVLFTQHVFAAVTYDHGKCTGSGNTYRGCPRVYDFGAAGGPHTMLGEYFENVGATPIGTANRHAETMIHYRQDGSPQQWLIVGTFTSTMGPPRVVTTVNSMTLTRDENGTSYTNAGATSQTVFTLPSAVEGVEFTFSQLSNSTIKLQAVGNDIIRLPGGTSSTAAGSITSAARGDFITLRAFGDANWCSVAHGGGWVAA